MHVRIGASVRVVFSSQEVIETASDSGTLILTGEHKVTRRIQTHRRHLQGLPIPDRYFELAREL